MAAKQPKKSALDPEAESEDLFGFDKIGAPADDGAGTSMASLADGIDLEELFAALPDLGRSQAERSAERAAPPAEEQEPKHEDRKTEEVAAPAPAVAAPTGPTRFSPALLAMLALVTLLNVGAVGLTWRTSRKLERTVSDVGKEVIHTAEDIRDQTAERTREIEQLVQPIVAPDSSQRQSLKWAQEDLERGDFAMARKRLYGLLAVIDSFDAKIRDDVGARASFLLADSLLLEAQARREELP